MIKIYFAEAGTKHVKFLFDIRNNELTRLMSINSEPLEYREYLRWLIDFLEGEGNRIFVAYNKDTPIGYLKIDNFEFLSWAVEPEFRGLGYGKEMLKQFCSLFDRKFIACIKPSNLASQKIAKHAGFCYKENYSTGNVELQRWKKT